MYNEQQISYEEIKNCTEVVDQIHHKKKKRKEKVKMEFTSLLNTSLDLNSKPNATHAQQERGALMEELNRVNAENKKLTELLTVMCENYNELRNKLTACTSKNPPSRKRKATAESSVNYNNSSGVQDNGNVIDGTNNVGTSESSSGDEDSSKKRSEEANKAKISQIHVRAEASDTSLIVKDGYQWRKYGQKVTRDNPSPRAYFKCSFAPSCPVKKKVQRSVEDQSIVVATYEGEHNHPHPPKGETNVGTPIRGSTLGNVAQSAPTITIDLTKRKPEETRNVRGRVEAPQLQQHYFVEQMASTLTKDPTFKAALAAAISGQFLQPNNL